MSADSALRGIACSLLLCGALVVAEEADAPELDFLEYLGMWEESDEEWQVLEETLRAENEERSEPAPEGEESTEKEDES